MGRFTLEQVTGRDTEMCCGYGGFLSCIHTKDLKVQYVIILSSPFFSFMLLQWTLAIN